MMHHHPGLAGGWNKDPTMTDASLIDMCRKATSEIEALDVEPPIAEEVYQEMERHGQMVQLICETPAKTFEGLKAKASVIVLIAGAEAALELAKELLDFDVVVPA